LNNQRVIEGRWEEINNYYPEIKMKAQYTSTGSTEEIWQK
jgi:hypothetical protein